MKSIRVMYLGVLFLFSGSAFAADFGDAENIAYAKDLWQAMTEAGYVGSEGLMSRPYTGQHPHGAILDTISGKIRPPKDSERYFALLKVDEVNLERNTLKVMVTIIGRQTPVELDFLQVKAL